jgi:RNA polymerase sigma factor (sigma-70 family)
MMTVLTQWDILSDAELAGAAAAGNRGAFAGIYDRYADRLHDFCVGMLRDRDAAADCVQDVFCTAASQLAKLREPDKLRPWLYAIARNEALRRIRERRLEAASDEVPDAASREPGPDTLAARTELASLISDAAGGLSERDRSVLELTYRHGLDGPELAEALGVTPGNANRMVSRLRQTVEHSLGALLVARRAHTARTKCTELSAILEGWDGRFSVLTRKRIVRHIESCPTCDQERRRLVNPVALLGGAPVFIPAPGWLRDHTLGQIQLSSASTAIGTARQSQNGGTAGRFDAGQAHADRGRLVRPGALFVGTLIASLGVTMAWLHHQNAVTPTQLGGITPEVSNASPPAPAPAISPSIPAPTSQANTGTAPVVTAPSGGGLPTLQTHTSGLPSVQAPASSSVTGPPDAPTTPAEVPPTPPPGPGPPFIAIPTLPTFSIPWGQIPPVRSPSPSPSPHGKTTPTPTSSTPATTSQSTATSTEKQADADAMTPQCMLGRQSCVKRKPRVPIL